MSKQVLSSKSVEPFELVEDPASLQAASGVVQPGPWIDPDSLRLTHRIGRGPFGDVWIATHHVSTEDYDEYHEVAIKMLPPVKEDQINTLLAKFNEAFYNCDGLYGVCFLHGVTVKDGNVGIVMKFYEGSLGDKMARLEGGKFDFSDVRRYGLDLARGTLELHSRGTLVLNLKPCNFLLNEQGRAVLGDFGIPSLLHGIPSTRNDIVQRLGTPNYMAPEQWKPDIRGPISYETDSWGFGCSIIEMLNGYQPWNSQLPNQIYDLVVLKQEKPSIPSGLPPMIEDILHGCFEYDLRNRPLMSDILHAFESCKDAATEGIQMIRGSYTNWSFLKDQLQIGDTVRSRRAKNTCKPENMVIPEGTIVGMDGETTRDGFILVRVHGMHNPVRVHSSTVERISYGFAAGDWVRMNAAPVKNSSPVGILHSVDREGNVTAGFIGLETLWKGNYFHLQMSESFCKGQFVTLKPSVSSPRFKWPQKSPASWATGRIQQILPNGCLVVTFPGRLVFGESETSFLADPVEVQVVEFSNCEGVLKKYQHLEDFHWAVRPLVIVFGLFTAVKLGLVIGHGFGGGSRKKASASQPGRQPQDGQGGSNVAWLPSNVANILFREGSSSGR